MKSYSVTKFINKSIKYIIPNLIIVIFVYIITYIVWEIL